MPLRGNLVGTALLSLGVLSCAAGTGPADGVELRVTAVVAVGATLDYEFDLQNRRGDAIYLPACAQYVGLDFTMSTSPPDRVVSGICLAVLDGSPRRVGAGQILSGRGSVARRAGVSYTPSVRASAFADLRETVTVRARSFVAP